MREAITIFDRATGAIKRQQRVAFGREAIIIAADEDWIAGRHDDGAVYIDPASHEPAPLKTFDVAITPNTITGIPAGTWAIVDLRRVPSEGTIDDGELILSVAMPHTAHVVLQCPLHHPLELEVPCEA